MIGNSNLKLPDSFYNVSEEVGKNKILVQGPGGNISYKINDSLYVKASGTNLKDAKIKNIFVKTNLVKIRLAIDSNNDDPLIGTWNTKDIFKPSIETTLHALMPHKCVLHVHCINSLSWLVRSEFEDDLKYLLPDIKWATVPYIKPGYELTKVLKNIVKENSPDAIFLANHGIVAGNDDPNKVLDLVKKISKRLFVKPIELADPNIRELKEFIKSNKYKLPKYNYVHKIALSDVATSIISKGTLFPDQIVFFKKKVKVLKDFKKLIKYISENKKESSILLIQKKGVLVPINFSDAAEELLYGLSLLLERIPSDTSINYLSPREENDLLNWNAEKFRQSVNT